MKINIPQNVNLIMVLRRSGYGLVRDRRNPEQSFSRRLGGGFYPRFHAYLNEGNIINLHLDQKQASYKGQTKHSGEYDGQLVDQEAKRIRQVADDLISIVENQPKKEENKGFFAKIFR